MQLKLPEHVLQCMVMLFDLMVRRQLSIVLTGLLIFMRISCYSICRSGHGQRHWDFFVANCAENLFIMLYNGRKVWKRDEIEAPGLTFQVYCV